MTAEEDRVRKIATLLGPRLIARPQVVVILGSGLGDLNLGRSLVTIPYPDIPGFPVSGVAGHPGSLSMVGKAAVLRGRAHYYEGYSFEEVVRPLRVLSILGARALVVTGAAGSLRRDFKPGELMLLTDHLNLMGGNPLRGRNPRFTDLTAAYDPVLRKLAEAAARKRKVRIRKGIYAAVAGPNYETPAEVRMLRSLGADAVGMSIVPEVLAANDAGMRVLGLALLTNLAAGLGRTRPSHEEVLAASGKARPRVEALLREILG